MQLKKTSILCLAVSSLLTTAANAWESADGTHSTSASIAGSSDYVWRGYSQTDEDAAISGSFDYGNSSGFYAGIWGSKVGFAKDADIEIDVYAGFSNEVGDSGVSYDVGALRYMYPGTTNSSDHNGDGEPDGSGDLDWNEFYGFLSYSFFNIGVAYSGDFANSSETAIYYSAGFDYDLPQEFALSVGAGLYDYDEDIYGSNSPDSAVDYHLGVSKEFIGFGFDLTYYDTDSDAEKLYGKDTSGSRFVFTISKSM